MDAFFARIAQFFPATPSAGERNDAARQLLECAEARAGFDPQESRELRSAAYALLRVVR